MKTLKNKDIINWIQSYADIITEEKDYLTELDSAIGDGDHGINMHRGFKAVKLKLNELTNKGIGTIYKTIATTLISTVGGASGPLYGTFFLKMFASTNAKNELTLEEWANSFKEGVNGVIMRGKANIKDKTMIDTLLPAINSLKKSIDQGLNEKEALQNFVKTAEEGMKSTIPLMAKKGRASYLGKRSMGHQDPGATSSYLLIKSFVDTYL